MGITEKSNTKTESIDFYLDAVKSLVSDKDKEFIEKIRQTYERLGVDGVREEIEMSPDVFEISGRAARDVVGRAMARTSEMHDALEALHDLIDRNI